LGILVLESFTSSALGLAVGAAAPSTEAALAIGPAVILVSIVFGGLFVNEQDVPAWLAWVPNTSLIKQVAAPAPEPAGWGGEGTGGADGRAGMRASPGVQRWRCRQRA
jgi:hypothetical protein